MLFTITNADIAGDVFVLGIERQFSSS